MKKLLLSIIILAPYLINAQEELTGLSTNSNYLFKEAQTEMNKGSKDERIELPFRDDFSLPTVFPLHTLWTDREAFINSDYPVYPITTGVATLDALNDIGHLYDDADAFPFEADHLSSKPIRLDSVFGTSPSAITVGDSIYLSFAYQPGGAGNAPNIDDSLVLEFYSDQSQQWNWVWASDGFELQEFVDSFGVHFKEVMIPVTDSLRYFNDQFRFRFRNIASLANNSIPSWAGNVDQWHIDYIYLARNRSFLDSTYNDIGFVNRSESILKDYFEMPWSHFNAAGNTLLKDSFHHQITNLDNIIYNSKYDYSIREENGNILHQYSGGNINLSPYQSTGYQSFKPHSAPVLNFTLSNFSSETALVVDHIVKMVGTTDEVNQNDTLRHYQKFYNYFAYDDGNPEAGYGLALSNGRLAVKFTAYHQDSLQSVQMFFNRVYNDGNVEFFTLTVWDDNGGVPGNPIYEQTYQLPEFVDGINQFHTYVLDSALAVSGDFYVGWRQNTSHNLNIGYDFNNNHQDKIFFNVGAGWTNSLFSGTVMVRPIVGNSDQVYVGIEDEEVEETGFVEFKIYPNPTSSHFNIQLNNIRQQDKDKSIIQLFDLRGQLLNQIPYQEMIDVESLSEGIYLIRIILPQGQVISQKLIKQ